MTGMDISEAVFFTHTVYFPHCINWNWKQYFWKEHSMSFNFMWNIYVLDQLVSGKSYKAGTACWLERRTRDRNVASSNPGRSGWRTFFSSVNFVCWLLFGVRSTPVRPQWHVKDLGHSCKSAGGRLHLNTHTPLTQQSRSGLTMPLSRHSVGTYHETSSHEFIREHSATVVSARWATVARSWPKEWN